MRIGKDGWIQLPQSLLDEMNWKVDDTLVFQQVEERLLLYKEGSLGGEALFVRCFGHFSIEYAGAEIIVKNKKLREMLAFLVSYNNELISKWTIAQQLWPDSPKTQAMDCLYKVLRGFSESEILVERIPLEIYREQLRIHLSVNELDVLLFEQFVQSEKRTLWKIALDLYRGGFLEMEYYEWSLLLQMKYEILFEFFWKKIKNDDGEFPENFQ